MRVISHRGNLSGPDVNTENRPEQIKKCLEMRIDVEIDVRYINGEWFLGHDSPDYKINLDFLLDHSQHLWVHCKNFAALENLNGYYLNYFWHDTDNHVLTSKNFIWTFPGKEIGKHNIIVMPEKVYALDEIKNLNCYGICTDYVTNFL